MNIKVNNINKDFRRMQSARSETVPQSSPRKYYDTSFLSFKGDDKTEAKKEEKKSFKGVALKSLAAAAIIAGALYAHKNSGKLFKSGKTPLITNDEYNDIVKQTNGLLGKDFFKENLDKSGWESYSDIRETNFIQDVLSTLADIPGIALDGINAALSKAGKAPKDGILAKRVQSQKAYEARNLVLNVVNQYKKCEGNENEFARAIAKNINHTNPNYRTRDERVLNRIMTGMVSAYYAGNDFYNISMLKKDNKEEATESANSRMKQEGSRMLLNAGVSFFTYGALDKYIKNSKFGTVLSAGISALFAEVVSRLISDTPLLPLSSEEAYKRAHKDKKTKPNKTAVSQNASDKIQTPKPSFKGNVSKTGQNDIFKDFAKEDGSFAALNEMNKVQENETEKQKDDKTHGSKFVKVLAAASALFSVYYLLNSSSKTNKYIKEFYNKTGLSKLKDLIKHKKVTIDVDSIKEQLGKLSSETTPDGKNLAESLGSDKLLNTFSDIIGELEENGIIKNGKMESKKDRFFIAALYKGFAKMGNTIATILSIPGRIIKAGYDKLFPKAQKAAVNAIPCQKKSVEMLDKILKDNNKANATSSEIIKDITKNVQDVKAVELEMSDLASDCRTIVTGVSTYFFVNDYRNKVLIESEGKDTEGANAEMKERLAHKAFNFVFNGTLMNVFNKTFEKAINKNIWIAGLVAMMTEFCNENLIRFSICSPAKRMDSKEDIIEYDEKRANKKGFLGAYTKLFKKLTGKKTIVEKADSSKANKK